MKSIRATEVRNYIRAKGEQGIIECIEQLYERQAVFDQQMREVAIMQLQMIKSMEGMMTVSEAMKNALEPKEEDDDLPSATGH